MRERLSEFGVKPNPVNLASMFLHLRRTQRSKRGPWRPAYTWSILDAAATAQSLDIERISVLELGVAGGGGLLALEAAAEGAETLLSTRIDVYGFDTGGGLPVALDARDAPFAIQQGDFAMDEAKLRSRLRRARLLIGDVKETVHEFLSEEPAPIGFISFDLDYYSSTMDSFALLETDSPRLLPRVMCCFDDVLWYPWTELTVNVPRLLTSTPPTSSARFHRFMGFATRCRAPSSGSPGRNCCSSLSYSITRSTARPNAARFLISGCETEGPRFFGAHPYNGSRLPSRSGVGGD